MNRRRRALTAFVAVLLFTGVLIPRLLRWRDAHLPNRRELFDQALKTGKNAEDRNYVFAEIARAQAIGGFYDDALATAQLVNQYQDQLFADVLRIRAKADLEGAKNTLSKLPSGQAARSVREVAVAEAHNGDLNGALRTTDGQFADELRETLADAQLEAGNVEGALLTVSEVQTPDEVSDGVLYSIARELAKRGEVGRARKIASRINDPQIKADAVPSPFEGALAEDLNRAADLARKMAFQQRCDALLEVAKELMKGGRRIEAGRILAEATAEAQKIRDNGNRAEFLGRAAVFEIESGLPVLALQPLKALPDNLTMKAELFGTPTVVPVGAVCQVAWAYARKRKFQEAYDLAARENCISGVAIEQYEAGDFEGALAGIRRLSNPSDQSSTFATLAKIAAKKSDLPNALRFADLISNTSAYERGEGYLAPALRDIGRAWANSGRTQEAYRWARSRSTAYERTMALLGIAEAIK